MAKRALPQTKKQAAVCNKPVRQGSAIKDCGTKYLTERCHNSSNHMLPMLTGFCKSGWHEGDKIDKPTCKEYLYCPCECHTNLWLMFEMTGRERVMMNNSTWKPGGNFVMAAEVPSEPILSIPADPNPPAPEERAATAIVPAHEQRTFAPTKDGRAAKGELEMWVKEITDIWVVERDNACTPGYISNEIGRMKGFKPPSTGAITNVIRRWTEIGFGTHEDKPLRFTGYTEAGIKFGLEAMKRRAKR